MQKAEFDKKVPVEVSLNHTMVGATHKLHVIKSLYNPHNYRLYFSFTKDKFKPHESMVGVWLGKFINFNKEFTSVGEGVRVTIKRTKAEVINKLSEDQWFAVSRAGAMEEIHAILNDIDKKCISSLRKFIEVYGGNTDYVILKRECRALLNNLNTKSDNKVMKEPFIDSLPLSMVFETEVVKKVYKKPNVEFKEPIYAANYLENSALREFTPEIANELEKIWQFMQNSPPKESELAELRSIIEESEDIDTMLKNTIFKVKLLKLDVGAKQAVEDEIFKKWGV